MTAGEQLRVGKTNEQNSLRANNCAPCLSSVRMPPAQCVVGDSGFRCIVFPVPLPLPGHHWCYMYSTGQTKEEDRKCGPKRGALRQIPRNLCASSTGCLCRDPAFSMLTPMFSHMHSVYPRSSFAFSSYAYPWFLLGLCVLPIYGPIQCLGLVHQSNQCTRAHVPCLAVGDACS